MDKPRVELIYYQILWVKGMLAYESSQAGVKWFEVFLKKSGGAGLFASCCKYFL